MVEEARNACKNKFSIKLFSFLSTAAAPRTVRPHPLNGYVADLIQIFFFFVLFSYPFRKLFFPVPLSLLFSRNFPLSFPQFSNEKLICFRINSPSFIVVCALDQSSSFVVERSLNIVTCDSKQVIKEQSNWHRKSYKLMKKEEVIFHSRLQRQWRKHKEEKHVLIKKRAVNAQKKIILLY